MFSFKLMISRNILVGLVFTGVTGRFVLEMLNSKTQFYKPQISEVMATCEKNGIALLLITTS